MFTTTAPRNQDDTKSLPHLAGLPLADNPEFDAGSEVGILIDCDESGKFFTGEMRMGEENKGPTAMNTSLGWILSGPGVSVRSKKSGHEQAVATYLPKIDCLAPSEDHQLTKFWGFESIGIRDKETVTEAFEKNITFENGRYSVTLPFKENSPVLHDNYENTLHRFDSTVKHLKKDPKVFEACDSIVKDQLERGIIEPVDTTKPVKVGEVHYLPSQVVTRQDALTTKIRIFYASSKSNGVCLNDTLHTGPSLTEQLYAVLMRFRGKKIGVIADVEKAFLAIGVDESQRDYLRFLSLANIADDNPEIVVYRFCSEVFGLCCSPFIMNATLQHLVKQYEEVDPEFVKLTLNSFYCDDLPLSVNSLEEAVSVCLKANERYSRGNLFLRKWNSNSKELMSVLHAELKSREIVESCDVKDVEREDESFAKLSFGKFDEIETPKEQKVLGLNRNTENDILTLKFGKIVEVGKSLEPTKRSVLKTAAEVFDPLGVISPTTLKAKLLFQELCLLKLSWDDDWGGPLTPSHLVVGRKISNLPDYKTHDFEDLGQTSTLISKRMKYLSKLLEHFWHRWQKEYLLGLRAQHRLSPRRNIGDVEISVGDVVIFHEEGLPRPRWRLGRISKEKMDMLEEHVLLFVRNKEKSRKLSAHCKNSTLLNSLTLMRRRGKVLLTTLSLTRLKQTQNYLSDQRFATDLVDAIDLQGGQPL